MENKKYKLSQYVRFYENEQGVCVFHSGNGFKALINDQSMLEEIEALKSGIDLEQVNEQLLLSGICVETQLNEFALYSKKLLDTMVSDYSSLHLIILPTRECNFRCLYCFEEKRPQFMSSDLSENIIAATIRYIEQHKAISQLEIEWFGGEPLLAYDTVIDISSKLYAYCNERSIVFNMAMTTNAYLLTLDKAIELSKYNLVSYQITIDGDRQYHDKLRVLKNGAGSYDTVYSNVKGLKNLDDSRLRVRIRINYYSEMLVNLKPFLIKLKNDFDDNRFTIYMNRINPPPGREMPFDSVSMSMQSLAQDYIIDLYKKVGLDYSRYLSNIQPYIAYCYARRNNFLIIDVDGNLKKCTDYLEDTDFNIIGKVSSGQFIIDSMRHAQWLITDPKLLEQAGCNDCIDYPICSGGACPATWHFDKKIVCSTFHHIIDNMMEKYFYDMCNPKPTPNG
jgi:uncharacterized protein